MPLLSVPSSTGPAVRQWLYDRCIEYLTPDPLNPSADLLVCFDEPGPSQPDDVIAIGEINRSFEPSSFVGGGGAGWLAERYTVTIVVDVFRGGDDSQTAYTRCQLLADTIIAIVRTDLTAGGNVLVSTPHSNSGHGEWDPGHLGRHWLQEVVISFYARI